MRTFEQFNPSFEAICPICGTAEIKETILVPIVGTESGSIFEAVQVHTDCLQNRLFYYEKHNALVAECPFKTKKKP